MPHFPVFRSETFIQSAPTKPDSTKKTAFSALPYYKAALAILSRNPRLIVWKIASDVCARATSFLVAFITFTALGISIFTAPEILQRPAFITGLTGTAFVLWLISLFFSSFTHSGIYATLSNLLTPEISEDASPPPRQSFFSLALERLDATLGLQILSLAARAILVFLAAALALTLISTFPLSAQSTSSTQTSLVWAFGIALYMVFTLLMRLTIELIAAPLFLEKHSLSDAILHAADFVLEHPVQLYRIFIAMLSTMLIPMGVYFLLLMTQNAILMFAPPLAPLGLLIRFAADLFLFISLAAVAVIFYAATFAYYGEQRALWTTSHLEEFMDNPEKSAPGFLRALFRPANNTPPRPQSDFSEGATLTSLTPEESPNIVSFQQIFDAETLASFNTTSENNSESDQQILSPSEPPSDSPDSPADDSSITPENNSDPNP